MHQKALLYRNHKGAQSTFPEWICFQKGENIWDGKGPAKDPPCFFQSKGKSKWVLSALGQYFCNA